MARPARARKPMRPVPVPGRLPDCIVWASRRTYWGYGVFRGRSAHRKQWEQHHGPIPRGLKVLHRCDNPPCINIAHLFLGTHADNMRDMKEKGRARSNCTIRGDDRWGTKLSDARLAELRETAKTWNGTQRLLAHKFGISAPHLCGIMKGKKRRQ